MTRFLSLIHALRIKMATFYYRHFPEKEFFPPLTMKNPRRENPACRCFKKKDLPTNDLSEQVTGLKPTFVFSDIKVKNKTVRRENLFDFLMPSGGFPAIAGLRMVIPFSVKQHLPQPLLVQLVLYKSYPPKADKLLVKNYSGLKKKF